MWEAGNALATISAAADAARRNSAMVVLTAGDAGVVQRHTQEIWQMINAGIDMLFCNKYVTPAYPTSVTIVLYGVCACVFCTDSHVLFLHCQCTAAETDRARSWLLLLRV